jgi:glyoxylate/hydroxypyruvate reductase
MSSAGITAGNSNPSPSGPNPTPLRVLVTFPLPPPSLELLQQHSDAAQPLEIRFCEGEMEDAALLKAELKRHAPIDALICRPGNKLDPAALESCGPNLRAISTLSVGFNHIDVSWCSQHGIPVGFSPDTVTGTTADTALALVLAVSRRVLDGHRNVVDGEWGKAPFHPYHLAGYDVHHSTVGIVGLGRIGLAVAKRLKAFDCHILYSGPREKPESAAQVDAEFVSFDELLKRSDFVIPQVPLTDKTKNLFGAKEFQKMKKTAILINTTRGAVVDQLALADALKNGVIWGAGLDVTEPEPLSNKHPLVGLPNCLILPHLGTATYQCRHETAEQTIFNLMHTLGNKHARTGGDLYGGRPIKALYVNEKEIMEKRNSADTAAAAYLKPASSGQ